MPILTDVKNSLKVSIEKSSDSFIRKQSWKTLKKTQEKCHD